MSDPDLADALSEIIDILRHTGYADRAAWMEERLVVLGVARPTQATYAQATSELHSVVLGMGGLLDLDIRPEEGSSSVSDVRERLDKLSDSLYFLTR